MSIISEFKKQEVHSKPNPAKSDSEWFIPFRGKCHICKNFGRKPVFKNLYQLYYHYAHKHGTELEKEWRSRIEELLQQVKNK